MSPNSKVCRVCLSVDVTICKIADTPLQQIYEKLTNSPLHAVDKPTEVCYVCYADLNKCRMVMVNAVKADNVLTALLQRSKVKKKSVPLPEHGTASPIRPQSTTVECVDTVHFEGELKSEGKLENADVGMKYEVLEETPLESDPIGIPDGNNCDGDDYSGFIKQTDELIENSEEIIHDDQAKKRKADSPRNNGEKLRNTRENDEETIQCHICRCTFKHLSNLRKHMSSHSSIKYECSICKRIFGNRGNLIVHIKRHNVGKSYKCHICQNISKSEDKLQRHLLTHRLRLIK